MDALVWSPSGVRPVHHVQPAVFDATDSDTMEQVTDRAIAQTELRNSSKEENGDGVLAEDWQEKPIE